MRDFIAFNSFSICLALLIAAVSGPVFAITHEATLWVINKWRRRNGGA
jgi:hypothetical protein